VIQVIVYSVATGRVRRVIDPQGALEDVALLVKHANVGPGEAGLVYIKQGAGLDQRQSWQAAVTAHTGLTPADDRYCLIDASNRIVSVTLGDPACGDGYAGCTLVAHSAADPGWTYSEGVFTPPATP
jgi:hypothetical protein